MNGLAVLSTGMVCGLALDAANACAALRCGLNAFAETRFVGQGGAWLVGSAVPLAQPSRGVRRLADMAALALRDCLGEDWQHELPRWPVILCVAEAARPGRVAGLDGAILAELEAVLGLRLHPHSRVVAQGNVGGAIALRTARRLLALRRDPVQRAAARVVVVGTDSLLTAATLAAYDSQDRLLRPGNSNGFIPGEAAAALLLATAEDNPAPLLCDGLGFAREPAHRESGVPCRAQGLAEATRAALAEAGIALHDCDHRIADVTGEHDRFREAALLVSRLLRQRKVLFSLWQPVDGIGVVGAATLPAMLAILHAGARKDYLPGPVFIGHVGNDDDLRAAFVARATVPQSLARESVAEDAFGQRRRGAP